MSHGADGSAKQHSYDKPSPVAEGEEEDPVVKKLRLTGCLEHHYALQECMYEHRDWRKCQDSVKLFKECMSAFEARREANRV